MNLIDTHCHIDLYPNPHRIAKECEEEGVFTIGMTLLPSHFEMGIKHISNYKHVHLALGMHPLHAHLHESEFENFKRLLDHTLYVGEIGLDFSYEGVNTKEIQINSFNNILSVLSDKRKIISLHSRKAEKEVLEFLKKYTISNAIFHWYSGPNNLIKEIVSYGGYFSINPAMIKSDNGRKIIQSIPRQNILTETDGPFITAGKIPLIPQDVIEVVNYLSNIWAITTEDTARIIYNNFSKLLMKIK